MEVQVVSMAQPSMTFVVFCELLKLPSISAPKRGFSDHGGGCFSWQMTQYFVTWRTFPDSALRFPLSWDLPCARRWVRPGIAFRAFFFFLLGKSRSHHSWGQTLLGTSKQELPSQGLPCAAFWRTSTFCSWGVHQGSKHPIQKITFPEGSPLWHRVRFAAPMSARKHSSMHACMRTCVCLGSSDSTSFQNEALWLIRGINHSLQKRPASQSAGPSQAHCCYNGVVVW